MTIAERLEPLDDGSRTRTELAEIIGCSPSYVSYLRHTWIAKCKAPSTDTCARCEFPGEPKIPIMPDGLCLWCALRAKRIDPKEFYESGAWVDYIEWRPGDDDMDFFGRMRDDLLALFETMTPEELGRERGVNPATLRYYASANNHGGSGQCMAEVAKALGIHPPNGKGIGKRYGVPGRIVCHYVRGW